MPPKLLVLDLDGTTLNQDKQIDPRDVAAARALRARGVQITVATGRLFAGTSWAARALGVQGSVAVMNGSELVDVGSGQVTHGRYFREGVGAAIRRVMQFHPLHSFLFRSGSIHYGRRSLPFQPYLKDWSDSHQVHDDLHDSEDWHSDDLLSIGMLGDQAGVSRARAAIQDWLPPELGLIEFDTYKGERFLSVHHSDEDKGVALRRLARERGVAVEDTVAVGDWLNDVPMFKVAGRSFCMGGAMDEVAAHADEVLSRPRHGGGAVAEVAERVWGVTL